MKIGMSTLLGLLFITLKLCHAITWSWLWVLSPWWLGYLIWATLAFLIIAAKANRR